MHAVGVWKGGEEYREEEGLERVEGVSGEAYFEQPGVDERGVNGA